MRLLLNGDLMFNFGWFQKIEVIYYLFDTDVMAI